ncbi:MAG: PBP1A family penicillin-binding protein [Rickettsiales bacterium]|jgi:penicillin-binding protein 1A|nr:PBP1A family penicillin-binding protein [Rickettsiales bacterium]
MNNAVHKVHFFTKVRKRCFSFLIIFSTWLVVGTIIFVFYCSTDLPNLHDLMRNDTKTDIKLLYSNDNLLKNYSSTTNEINNYAELPFDLLNALIATEDRKFFKHSGFDYLGILRAAFVNLKSGSIRQGGSTITQQVAKTLLRNSKKTFKRKVQELLLSIQLEKKMSKEEILLLYLNKSYFGAGKYGILNASKFYFNKNVSDLNLEESAMLVGLLKAPSRYTPQNNPELSIQRTKQVIVNMKNAGLLDDTNFNGTTLIENTTYNINSNLNQEIYFADYIKGQLQDYTSKQDIIVKTTLNDSIQNAIENTIKHIEPKHQIAVVVLNRKGAILGMTGGIDYNSSEFNRAIYGSRQAGSAFKLFVYLAGLEKGLEIDNEFVDEPIAVGTWFPENYNEKYYGKISMLDAFAKSSNSVAVQISEIAKPNNVAKMAKKMGISSPIDKDDPTIALGTTQVNLLELTSSYAVVINDGKAVIPFGIREIRDYSDDIIYEKIDSNFKVILNDKLVSDAKKLLKEVVTNGTGKRAYLDNLSIGGKTGTTQNYADAWFVGYVGDIVIGVWVGNDDNSSMKNVGGSGLPIDIWKGIVERLK